MAHAGDALVAWVQAELATAEMATNLAKLERAHAPASHLLLVFPPMTTAPDSAVAAFFELPDALPTFGPSSLPPPLTDVWLVSGWAAPKGLRYNSAAGWTMIDTMPEPAANG